MGLGARRTVGNRFAAAVWSRALAHKFGRVASISRTPLTFHFLEQEVRLGFGVTSFISTLEVYDNIACDSSTSLSSLSEIEP